MDNVLSVELTKATKSWWPSIVKGEAEIDLASIEPETMRLEDVEDANTKSLLREVMEERLKEQTEESVSYSSCTK